MSARNGTPSEDPGKRQAILEQAIRHFARLGFRGTDVQDIADGAGVGKGTVYRYFRSKEDLFWATTYEVLLRLEEHLFRAMEGIDGAWAKLRAAAAAYSGFFLSNPQYLALFLQDRAEFRGCGPESHREHHEKMICRMGEILQQGIEAGELRPVEPRDHVGAGQPAVRRHGPRLPLENGARRRDDRVRRQHFSPGNSGTIPPAKLRTGAKRHERNNDEATRGESAAAEGGTIHRAGADRRRRRRRSVQTIRPPLGVAGHCGRGGGSGRLVRVHALATDAGAKSAARPSPAQRPGRRAARPRSASPQPPPGTPKAPAAPRHRNRPRRSSCPAATSSA